MPKTSLNIGGRAIGPAHPCFIIAEAGINHNGNEHSALELVDAAADAGASAVKFQTFNVSDLLSPSAPKAKYQQQRTGKSESQLEMLQKVQLTQVAHEKLQARCEKRKILFLSTPFDAASADMLAEIRVPALKIPSGEITNLPFLKHVASKGLPLVISTGMSNLGDVEAAVEAVESAGNDSYVLLHCLSNYPADPADCHLRAMQTLAASFGSLVGYSDHTLGTEVSLAAVALGACVLEKHITLDRSQPGPDHQASMEPEEFEQLVRGVRTVEAALGSVRKRPAASEADTAAVARKSLVAACDIPPGKILRLDDVHIKRPGTGLPPAMRPHIAGRVAKTKIPAGSVLTWEMLQ